MSESVREPAVSSATSSSFSAKGSLDFLRISRPCSLWLSMIRTMQQSAESAIDRPAIRTFDPENERTSSSNCPTRFSRKTENCVIVGQV